MHPIYIILLLLPLFITACNGQTKPRLVKDSASKPETTASTQGKMIKPPGTDNYTSVRCSLQDKAGNIWFGTTGAGVYRYDGKSFSNFTVKDGLSDNIVYCLIEDQFGNILFGTHDGVCRYDGISFTRFPIPGLEKGRENFNIGPKNLTDLLPYGRSVLSMISDRAGNLWFGTESMGLCRYDGRSFTNFKYRSTASDMPPTGSAAHDGGTWRMIPNDSVRYNNGRHLNDVQCVLEDKDGNIWFSASAHEGVYRYDGKSFTHFTEGKSFRNTQVFNMVEDKGGNIWFATRNNGLVRYDGKLFVNITQQDGLCDNVVSCMMEDKKGDIWFGSGKEVLGHNEGCVTRYDGKTFARFPMHNLGNTSVWNILEDSSGNLWFGSGNAGLSRYDGKVFTDFSD